MECSNKSLRGILYLLLILCAAGTANAVTSLYVIPNQDARSINAYEVNGYSLSYQDSGSIAGWGGVGLTLDPKLGILSMATEDSGDIALFDAIEMVFLKTVTVSIGLNLAGIVADSDNNKLYVIDRNTNHLYILSWNWSTQTYDLDLPSPYYVELDGLSQTGAFGLALDETNDILYVADRSYDVKTYDTSDWLHDPGDNITVSHSAIAVAVDEQNQYVYTGSMLVYGDGSYDLSRYDLNSSTESTVTVGSSVAGIAVDQSTNNVYLTTYSDGSYPHEVLIYSSSLTKVGPSSQLSLSKPTGLANADVTSIKSPNISVIKDDGLETCVEPDDEITYTITVNPNGYDHEYVEVIDYLPDGVIFNSPFDPNYSITDRTYTWQLGSLDVSDDPVELRITVTVNNDIEPGSELVNLVTAESDVAYRGYIETTDVCCWEQIIYVDDSATGYNTGTSWANAYTDLQDALKSNSAKVCKNDIWVAGGIYSPGNNTTNTFDIPAGVVVYGGLAGNEDPANFDPNDRETIKYKSVLTGNDDNDQIVTMGSSTKLHGFVVVDAVFDGIYGNGGNFTIERSVIKNCKDRGIECTNGNLTVNWCIIKNNTNDGIYCSGSNKRLRVYNCKIYNNGENGIYSYSGSTPFIKNSEIHHNGRDKVNNYDNGIKIEYSSDVPLILNCTIMRNEGLGVYYSGSNEPDIYNCIFYKNDYHGDLEQFSSGLTAHYSSVTNPNDPNSTDCTEYGDHNIACNPNFAYIDINDHNLHLAADSPCIDIGVPSGEGFDPNYTTIDYSNANDIDGDYRVYDDIVDMGSDEVSCIDEIANPLDWNGDGLVNNKEFAIFAKAWLSYDPNEAIGWDPRCDLNDDHYIDLDDFVIFAEDWLWQACWKDLEKGFSMMMSMGGGMQMMFLETAETVQLEPTIEEQIEQAESNIKFLEDIWENDEEVRETIDEDRWEAFIESVQDWLDELKEEL